MQSPRTVTAPLSKINAAAFPSGHTVRHPSPTSLLVMIPIVFPENYSGSEKLSSCYYDHPLSTTHRSST